MASSLASCLQSVGLDMPHVCDVVPLFNVHNVVESLTVSFQATGNSALFCPRQAPTQGVVSCTYEQWFRPYNARRRYCQLPVSGRRMQRFLQFRLGCHGLPVAIGRLAGPGHVARGQRICTCCSTGAVGDERHHVFECVTLTPLWEQYAGLFTSDTNTMRSPA
ncbi:hypothetical protein ABBQ32_14171 [Trebouxia sp. C0010 RCD-2024]